MSDLLTGGDLSPGNVIFGADAAADASIDAANIQAQAAREGIEETRRQFDVTQGTLRPAIEAGDVARTQQQALLGLSGQDAQDKALAQMQESPAQAFIRKRAQKNLLQNAAAIGGLGGGNVRTALVEQGAGFASQDLENQFNRLQGLSAPGTTTAIQQGSLAGQSSGQIAQLTGQAGAATASGILGAQQARSDANAQVVGAGTALGGAFLLSDERMKKDIRDLDLKECYDTVMSMDLKAWRYIEAVGMGSGVHLGPMAKDAPDCIRAGQINGVEALSLHDEIMLIAGAMKYAKQEGLLQWH